MNMNKLKEHVLRLQNWTLGIIGFISSIISFVILFKSNYFLSIVVSITILLITIFSLSLYVLFARSQPLIEGGKGVYIHEKYRPVARITIILVPLLVGLSVFVSPTRTFIINALTQNTVSEFEYQDGPVDIEQILIGSSQTHYRIEMTIRNSLNQDVLVKRLNLVLANQTPMACYELFPLTFSISDTFEIRNRNGKVEFIGTGYKDGQQDYSYQIIGGAFRSCGTTLVRFDFNTSFIVSAKEYFAFFILMPKSLKLKEMGYTSLPQAEDFMRVIDNADLESFDSIKIYVWTDYQNESISAYYGKDIDLSGIQEPLILPNEP